MGWIKDVKAQAIHDEANRAREQGRTVFVCRVNTPMTHHQLSGSLAGFAEQIEAVESIGWRLEHVSLRKTPSSAPRATSCSARR